MSPSTQMQLGFDELLNAAEETNAARQFERESAHLPATMAEAIPFYRTLVTAHHAAMLAGDVDEVMRLRHEAYKLATRLNNGQSGILADDDAPGCMLARETAAPAGEVPLWGQQGDFNIAVNGMIVRVKMDGIFGIGSCFCYWPGFGAHAVEYDRPFFSETGFRSFLGIHADAAPGLTPDTFASEIVAAYVAGECKGRLVAIEPKYRR